MAEWRKGTNGFLMSVRPSVCPHGISGLPLEGFLWNLIFAYFLKKLSGIFKCH